MVAYRAFDYIEWLQVLSLVYFNTFNFFYMLVLFELKNKSPKLIVKKLTDLYLFAIK